jgi:hypothetical protein
MYSKEGIQTSLWMGCPIRILKAHRLDAAPLERFVGLHVLHRSDAPRHPPRTLPRLLDTLSWFFTHKGSLRVVLASASLLFALGKIEVISFSVQLFKCRLSGHFALPTGMWKATRN